MTDPQRPRHPYPHYGYFCAEDDCPGYVNRSENRPALLQAIAEPLLHPDMIEAEAEAAPDLRAALAEALHIQPEYPCDCQSWPCQTYEPDFWLNRADEVIACMPDVAPDFEHERQQSVAEFLRQQAALAAPAADGLDVERLADAIWQSFYGDADREDIQDWERDRENAVEWYASPNEMAADIAAAYLHELSREPGEEG